MRDALAALGFARSLVIYRSRPWRLAAMARFYGQFVRPGDVAFDIGAHAGNRSLALARAGARVVALEPQSPFHAFLKRSMPPSVTVLAMAAGASEGSAMLAVSRRHPTVSSMRPAFGRDIARRDSSFRHVRWDHEEAVKTTTLDRLIETFGAPAFIKIDVEGFEADVLAGLSFPIGALAFEFLPGLPQVARLCLDRLEELGSYRFNLVSGERPAFALPQWTDPDTVLAAAIQTGTVGDIYARLEPHS